LVQAAPSDHAIDGMSKTRLRLLLLGVGAAEIGECVTRAAVMASSASFVISTFRFAVTHHVVLRET
jgi:hypothetical protein